VRLFEARVAAIKAEALQRRGMACKAARVWAFAESLVTWLVFVGLFFLVCSWLFPKLGSRSPLVPFGIKTGNPDKGGMVPSEPWVSIWLALMGGAAGAWISYALRSMGDDFSGLKALASDTVSPHVRTWFVFACVFAGVFLLHLQFVDLKIGKFETDEVLKYAEVAILAGVLFGLAERALPEALTQHAQSFASRMASEANTARATT
jgi:hypothetical protein